MRFRFLLVLASLFTVAACAAEPERRWPLDDSSVSARAPATATTTDDATPPSVPTLTIERNGEDLVSLTVNDDTGQPIASLFADGHVEVKSGTNDEAARAFFARLTDVLLTQCKKP